MMMTTIGKIPEEMFDADGATPAPAPEEVPGFTHSTTFLVLITMLVIVIFLCCLTAFILSKISKARRKESYENGGDECESSSRGSMKKPLLSSESSQNCQ